MGKVISVESISKNYGEYRALKEINFSVEEGEIFGFIGPNGAGKSTTIRILMGLLKASEGNAKIFGKDCFKDASEIAKNVGYLPSEDSYYKNLSVREMLNYTAELYKLDAEVRILNLSNRLNLDLSKKIKNLSLGNKKKVGIISALLSSPKLIVMDEPTSGLDPLVQQTFYEILKEENKRGATIFFSSHILSEVQKLCNRISILKDGRLIETKSMKDLRESGYKKISITISNNKNSDELFLKMPGIANFKRIGENISFIYSGNIMEILNEFNSLPIRDILIEEPSLEEIFLHYYH